VPTGTHRSALASEPLPSPIHEQREHHQPRDSSYVNRDSLPRHHPARQRFNMSQVSHFGNRRRCPGQFSRSIPTSTARSVRSSSQSIRSSAKARLPGSPRTLRSGRRARSREASGRGAARRRSGAERVQALLQPALEFLGSHGWDATPRRHRAADVPQEEQHGLTRPDTRVAPEQGVCATSCILCVPVPPSQGGDTGSNPVGTTNRDRALRSQARPQGEGPRGWELLVGGVRRVRRRLAGPVLSRERRMTMKPQRQRPGVTVRGDGPDPVYRDRVPTPISLRCNRSTRGHPRPRSHRRY